MEVRTLQLPYKNLLIKYLSAESDFSSYMLFFRLSDQVYLHSGKNSINLVLPYNIKLRKVVKYSQKY